MPLDIGDGKWTVTAERQYTYDIVARRGTPDTGVADLLNGRGVERWLVVVDENVHKLYRTAITDLLDGLKGEIDILPLSVSENRKDRLTVDAIITGALHADLHRRDEIIGIGGGVLLDLVGVAAAELRKETQYSLIPTTLVGDIDAALGFKRAVNFRYQPEDPQEDVIKKSLLGDYHPPRLVVIDPDFLLTLPPREVRAGMAEMKKVGEMVSPELFDLLSSRGGDLITSRFQGKIGDEALSLAVTGIMQQIAADPWEQNLRRWPDHGHSISPTLEMETALPHGYTVNICGSVGAALANGRVENGRKLLADEPFSRMLDLSAVLSLPIWDQNLADPDFLQRAFAAPIRVRGENVWPVPSGVGSYTFMEPSLEELQAACEVLREHEESRSY